MNDQGFDANFIATDDGRDPYPEYVKLREHTPVARQESMFEGAPPSYLVYRHADVTQVLRDGETFSSAAIAEGMRDVWGRRSSSAWTNPSISDSVQPSAVVISRLQSMQVAMTRMMHPRCDRNPAKAARSRLSRL
jgi:cytochrome P450